MAGEDLDELYIDVPDVMVKQMKEEAKKTASAPPPLEINFGAFPDEVAGVGKPIEFKMFSKRFTIPPAFSFDDKDFIVKVERAYHVAGKDVTVIHTASKMIYRVQVSDVLYAHRGEDAIKSAIEEGKRKLKAKLTKGTSSPDLSALLADMAGMTWGKGPATEKQINFIDVALVKGWITEDELRKAGLPKVADYMTKGQASAVITLIKERGH